MTTLRHRPLTYALPRAEVLTPRELARLSRWRDIYNFAGILGLECLHEARELLDHLEFRGYLERTERLN